MTPNVSISGSVVPDSGRRQELDHYELLGVARTASVDELKASLRRLAATHRPAELAPGALRQQRMGKRKPRADDSQQNVAKRELWFRIQKAFDVLANPKRREHYDRTLRATEGSPSGSPPQSPPLRAGAAEGGSNCSDERILPCPAPDLRSVNAAALLNVSGAFFDCIEASEPRRDVGAPGLGNSNSSWEEIRMFYPYWREWSTRREFRDSQPHSPDEIAAAPNRQVRRCMEAENEKHKKQRRREYSQRVRDVAEQLWRRDPRVHAHRQCLAAEAVRREEERAAAAEKEEEERFERRCEARAAEAERWASSPQAQPDDFVGNEPFFCRPCQKGFQTHEAWDAHAKSKKHRQNERRWKDSSPILKVASGQRVSPLFPPLSSPTLSAMLDAESCNLEPNTNGSIALVDEGHDLETDSSADLQKCEREAEDHATEVMRNVHGPSSSDRNASVLQFEDFALNEPAVPLDFQELSQDALGSICAASSADANVSVFRRSWEKPRALPEENEEEEMFQLEFFALDEPAVPFDAPEAGQDELDGSCSPDENFHEVGPDEFDKTPIKDSSGKMEYCQRWRAQSASPPESPSSASSPCSAVKVPMSPWRCWQNSPPLGPQKVSLTRSQLRESSSGVEGVVNRIRYDSLLDAEDFIFHIDVDEKPAMCRAFVFTGNCEFGGACKYSHEFQVQWWGQCKEVAIHKGHAARLGSPHEGHVPKTVRMSEALPRFVSCGLHKPSQGHVPRTEALPSLELFEVLDNAPSAAARHDFLQMVSFVLHKGFVVWCRDIGRAATSQRWESFVQSVRTGGSNTNTVADFSSVEMGSNLEDIPECAWEFILQCLGDLRDGISLVVGVLAGSPFRHGHLGQKGFWQQAASAAWGDVSCGDANDGGVHKFLSLAKGTYAAFCIWSAWVGPPGGPAISKSKKSSFCRAWQDMCDARLDWKANATTIVLDSPALSLRVGSSLVAAISQSSPEVRLFHNDLGRLPTFRTRGKAVTAFDILREGDVLAIGALDGQLSVYSLSDSKAQHHCVRRFGGDGNFFAGVHFMGTSRLAATTQGALTAHLLDMESRESICQSKAIDEGLLACEPLNENTLLLAGLHHTVCIWDLRSRNHALEISLKGNSSSQPHYITTASVDPAGFGVALLTGTSPVLHWLDVAAGKTSEALLPLSAFQGQEQVVSYESTHVALSGCGDCVVWLNGQQSDAGMACCFSGGPSLMPLHAGPAFARVTAVARPFGENFSSGFVAPPLIALAQPGKRRPHFEISMLGSVSEEDVHSAKPRMSNTSRQNLPVEGSKFKKKNSGNISIGEGRKGGFQVGRGR